MLTHMQEISEFLPLFKNVVVTILFVCISSSNSCKAPIVLKHRKKDVRVLFISYIMLMCRKTSKAMKSGIKPLRVLFVNIAV